MGGKDHLNDLRFKPIKVKNVNKVVNSHEQGVLTTLLRWGSLERNLVQI
jgi:hypothetical protein